MSSLENALAIVALLSPERPVLRVGEVCRELGIPKSSVSRLLRVISEHGLLERQQHDYGYVAGERALGLSALYLARHSLLEIINVALDRLVEEFGFVGYAGVLQGSDLVILRVKHGAYPLRLVQEVGKRVPVFRTAIGRALLTKKSDAVAVGLATADRPANLSAAVVRAELAEVRRTGLARTTSTVIPGIAAIGSAVHDPSRNEALGFSLSYPISAADEALRRRMLRRILEEAVTIGTRCGDPYWIARASYSAARPARSARAGALRTAAE